MTNNQVFKLIKKGRKVCDIYNTEVDKLAQQNNGQYNLDDESQRTISNLAFNRVLGESTINATYQECCAVFDIINRGI